MKTQNGLTIIELMEKLGLDYETALEQRAAQLSARYHFNDALQERRAEEKRIATLSEWNATSIFKRKRYTLYTFPSFEGSPRHFRFKIMAWLFAQVSTRVCELEDNKTGEYYPYWV